MADYKEKNEGQQQASGREPQGGSKEQQQEASGRNPDGGKSAGGQQGGEKQGGYSSEEKGEREETRR